MCIGGKIINLKEVKYGIVCIWGYRKKNNFFFETAMDDLFVETEKQKNSKYSYISKKKIAGRYTPRTLRQIYLMCKSRPVTDTYGDKEIGEMILDDRSLYRYPKGCFGKKIIESCINGRVYDNEKKQIFLVAPIVNKKYSFVLQFKDDKLYRTIRDEIYNNKDKMVVAGEWGKSEVFNCFISDIHSRKQILIIK